MPDIRVALSRNTHMCLKMVAAQKGTTLSGVVVAACDRYIQDHSKAKNRKSVVPMGDSRAPKKRA
jgi:hypothetical protein